MRHLSAKTVVILESNYNTGATSQFKKLSYRRETERRSMSVEILSAAARDRSRNRVWGQLQCPFLGCHVTLNISPTAATTYHACTSTLLAKFEVSSFPYLKIWLGPKLKNGSRDPNQYKYNTIQSQFITCLLVQATWPESEARETTVTGSD